MQLLDKKLKMFYNSVTLGETFKEVIIVFDRLKELRKSKGYTCAQMAKILGFTKATYSKKERGQMTITLLDAHKISMALGETIDNIFFDKKVTQNETVQG